MTTCNCLGPQNGEPLCPCQMAATRGYFSTDPRVIISDSRDAEIERLRNETMNQRAILLALYNAAFASNDIRNDSRPMRDARTILDASYQQFNRSGEGMSNIVKRLRESSSVPYNCQGCMDAEREEAADEIERLRAAQWPNEATQEMLEADTTMKVSWEVKDIVPGQRVGSLERQEQWMIGYDPSINAAEGNKVLVSLSDGMIAKRGKDQDIADCLNSNGDAPLELIQRPRRGPDKNGR